MNVGDRALKILLTATAATAMLAGCGERPLAGRVAAPIETSRPDAFTPLTGKPRPPVHVMLVDGPGLVAGVPGKLTIQVSSRMALEAVELLLEGDEGLAVVEVPGTGGTRYQSPGEAVRFDIAATPTSGGTRHVSGFLSFEVGGARQGMPFSLPVRVKGPVTVVPIAAKPERPPATDSTGELIDSMPAETTIR